AALQDLSGRQFRVDLLAFLVGGAALRGGEFRQAGVDLFQLAIPPAIVGSSGHPLPPRESRRLCRLLLGNQFTLSCDQTVRFVAQPVTVGVELQVATQSLDAATVGDRGRVRLGQRQV